MASTFLNLNRQFPTPAAFADWLHQQPGPDWPVDSITYHNTYIPNEAQWRGHESMRSMQTTYIGKGWDRGPHIYLASDAVRPEHRGVFVMTHPRYPGIHAGACNTHAYGVETVADWDKNQPTETQKAWLVEIGAILTDYSRRPLTVSAHRDCMSGRTCPGRYGYAMKPEIQHRLEAMLHTTVLEPDRAPGSLEPYTQDSPILGAPRATLNQVADWLVTYRNPSTPASAMPYTDADIRFIAKQYFDQAASIGVDPVLALAQLVKETSVFWSFWSQRPQRNPAGIGVTGQAYTTRPSGDPDLWRYNTQRRQWEFGVSFATWEAHSIPAHLGRLLAYATRPDTRTAAQQTAVDRALRFRDLKLSIHGSAPTIKQLGRVHNPTGNGWASPGTDYGQKLAQIANQMRGAS